MQLDNLYNSLLKHICKMTSCFYVLHLLRLKTRIPTIVSQLHYKKVIFP